jgi:hypothetical protein
MAHHDKTVPYVSQNLQITGGTDGTVTVASTSGFYTNLDVNLVGNGSSTQLVVLDVEGPTILRLGQRVTTGTLGNNPSRINSGVNLSGYTVAGGAAIFSQDKIKKPDLAADSTPYYAFETDPISANRIILVDQLGTFTGGNITTTTLNFGVTATGPIIDSLHSTVGSISAFNNSSAVGALVLQASNDGVNWVTYASANVTATASANSSFTLLPYAMVRPVFNYTSGTGLSTTIYVVLKN